jgi:MYXO-CTERM domain-containing protein
VKRSLIGAAMVAGAVLVARNASAQCPPRPADPGGYSGFVYAPEIEQTIAGDAVRVHYVTAGTHAASVTDAQYVSDTAEDALKRYGEMGFAKPPGDESCATANGGDAKLDIYLVKFAGADGSTVKAACSGHKCSSFMLVESTFKGRGYPTTNEGFRTVVVHELFHAVQNAYDADSEARFWQEGSAQWAMKTLHPELADFENQLPAFFADPKRSIDSSGSGVSAGFLYGSAVWPLFLTLRHGDTTVKEVWEHQANGEGAVPATDAVLQAKGSSLADEFPLFWAWNVGTKDRTGTGGYPDAAKYPGVKTVGVLADGAAGITSGLSAFIYVGDLGGKMKVSIETDETRNSGVLVPLDGEKTQLDKAQKLPAVSEGRALVVVTGITTKKTDAPFTVRVVADDGTTSSSSSSSSSSGGAGGGGDDGGCSCTTSSSHGDGAAAFVLAVLVLFALRGRARMQTTSHE